MRRASFWFAAALLWASPVFAQGGSGGDGGSGSGSGGSGDAGGQEVIVDPETGQVIVRRPAQSAPPPAAEQPPPPPAAAQPPPAYAEPPPPTTTTTERERETVTVKTEREEARERGKRTAVSAQAGLLTYAGEAARVTSPGATYGLSISRDLIRGVNAEFGYIGSSYRAQGASGGISENGGEALVKVGPEYGHFSPFALWGLELSWLGTHGATNGVQDSTLLRLPMGAGVSWTLPSDNPAEITLGVRAAYLFTLASGSFPGLDEPTAANQFLSTLSVGGRF